MFDICHAIIINNNLKKKENSYENRIKNLVLLHNPKFPTILLSRLTSASYFKEIPVQDLPNIPSEFTEKFGKNSFLLYPAAKISFYK